jgi:hypothetical protein
MDELEKKSLLSVRCVYKQWGRRAKWKGKHHLILGAVFMG